MNKTLPLICVLLFFAACKSENERRIVGKWQAAQLMECDNLVPIQTDLVDIEFMSNGKYIFHSTLNVKEEGNYRIKKNFLFTQDKLREKAVEKAVLIKSIDDDSLVLQMSYKGKDQWLTLIREGVSEKAREKEDEDAKAQALAVAAGTATLAAASMPATDSLQNAEATKMTEEEKKKQAEADKEAERKKAEAAADKKREEEADRKREAAKKKEKDSDKGLSAAEAYKKREAKRKAEERKAKEEAEKKAEKFRKEYAKREAEKKKKKK